MINNCENGNGKFSVHQTFISLKLFMQRAPKISGVLEYVGQYSGVN